MNLRQMPPLTGAILLCMIALGGNACAFSPPETSDIPDSIVIKGKVLPLKDLKNPYRQDTAHMESVAREGGTLYFQHCFLCHGDLLDGKGLFGDRFRPAPANLQKLLMDPPKPERYALWRILKGGPGLPEKNQPWVSAMPAWEDTLSVDEAWKIVLFIYETIARPTLPDPPLEPSVERGQAVYQAKCVYCHGPTGKGDGVAAKFTSPRPRNLTKGHIKFRTTPFGKIPTDEDLYLALTRGMPGTTMPSWSHLAEVDLRSLVLYLKTLSKKFAKFVKKGKHHKIVKVPDPPPFTLESVARGKKLFIENCMGCHGMEGRGDGQSTKKIVDIASDAIRPRNLTKPWLFRRGSSRKDLFMTIRTGLSTTAMPRFSPRVHSDENIWDIVNFVTTLSPAQRPEVPAEIKAQKTGNPLPLDPNDAAWKEVSSHFIPLGGQILGGAKAYFVTVDSATVQALYNDSEIAFRVTWDDPTYDPILRKIASVEESPAPPLPPELQPDEDEEPSAPPEDPKPQEMPDLLAIQLPLTPPENDRWPYFLNGDPDHPVGLWIWNSNTAKARQFRAVGLGTETPVADPATHIETQVHFRYGQYQLVMKRRRVAPASGNEAQVQKSFPIALNIWDGNEGEAGTRKAISSWFRLRLE